MGLNEYDDARIAALYDAENPWARDDDFFLALAAETPGSRVLDLGCGTGRLALALAAAGHRVTGIDPAPAMLDRARSKAGAERVAWVEGTVVAAPTDAFELALMTSHVAQVFVDDAEWVETLHGLARALTPGGRLAFDSRDPAARAWERWSGSEDVTLPDGEVVRTSLAVTDVRDGVISFSATNVFADGEVVTADSTLRFRGESELRDSLKAAGFAVEAIYGSWRREPVGTGDGELIVVARVRPIHA